MRSRRVLASFSAIVILFCSLLIGPDSHCQEFSTLQTARDGRLFKVFQFPKTIMPTIDAHIEDWNVVPRSYTYGTDELRDTEDGLGDSIDRNDLDVEVTIGWVEGLDRLYFLYRAHDDFWDFERFNPQGYLNDIFELVVDGDLSGGPFIYNPIYDKNDLRWGQESDTYIENHLNFSGVHAQNYHIYTPPVNNAWVLVWGSQPWISEFPYAHYAYDYDFEHGDSGTLVLEGWITPFDHAPSSGPQDAVTSDLYENKMIGLSWSILDFDGAAREGHINLAHNTAMVKDATYLCAFQLMPVENSLRKDLRAEWSFKVVDEEKGRVAFFDESVGTIDRWSWDFGDGNTSTEASPIYQFEEKGVRKIITLTVEGPDGVSKRTRYWEVMIR